MPSTGAAPTAVEVVAARAIKIPRRIRQKTVKRRLPGEQASV
jgi:hypothetical protein